MQARQTDKAMKTLKECFENYGLTSILEEHLRNHALVELRYEDASPVLESLGNFNNCGECAEYVVSKLINNNEDNTNIRIDCKKFKTYFDYVHLNVKRSKYVFFEYDGQMDRILSINAHVNETIDDYDSIVTLVLHEMMHGYEDKRRTKHGKPSIFNIIDDKYAKSIKLSRSVIDINREIGRCGYFLNAQEMNAYFGTLEKTIKDIIKANNFNINNYDYDKIITCIKNDKSSIWPIYFDLCRFILRLNDELEYNDKQHIERIYNDIYNQHMTFSQIKKDLNKKWDKFYKKFNKLVPKIICKTLVEQPHKRRYIDYLYK